jgi:hypothetical protein
MVTRYQSQCTECGWVIRGDTEDDVAERADRHRCGKDPIERTGPAKAAAVTPENSGLARFLAARHSRDTPAWGTMADPPRPPKRRRKRTT